VHVLKNADKELAKIKFQSTRELIRADIVKLQFARSEDEFDPASALWMKK